MDRSFRVFADWDGLPGPLFMGTLRESGQKGRAVASFEYDSDWLKRSEARSPDPDGQCLSLNISEDKNAQDFLLALSQAHQFGLSEVQAKKRLEEITAVVANWRTTADSMNLTSSSIREMERAFRVQ